MYLSILYVGHKEEHCALYLVWGRNWNFILFRLVFATKGEGTVNVLGK